jgi:carboxylate-amine ligase
MTAKAGNTNDVRPGLRFHSSPRHTVGVELEVSLVDLETRDLTARALEVFQHFEGNPYMKPELFQTIIEVITDVCEDVNDVRRDLGGKIDLLQKFADQAGFGLLCTGTHPFARPQHFPITNEPRYHQLIEGMAWPARRLLICGQHVHVGVPTAEHAIAITNSMRCFIPHLLALSASSPFWKGRDTGLASGRIKIFEGLPTAGLPPNLTNWNDFTSLMRTLLSAGTISSIREIWWDIRPHPGFGTVEIRICDGINTLDEICALTAFIQSMVVHLVELYDAGEDLPDFKRWTLRENKWRATRHGDEMLFIRNESGDLMPIREHIEEWLEVITPVAARLGCAKDLEFIRTILAVRPSSYRQRQRFAATGDLTKVVDGLLEEFKTNTPMVT